MKQVWESYIAVGNISIVRFKPRPRGQTGDELHNGGPVDMKTPVIGNLTTIHFPFEA